MAHVVRFEALDAIFAARDASFPFLRDRLAHQTVSPLGGGRQTQRHTQTDRHTRTHTNTE